MKHTTWVTADWHFNHANIIRYCSRPFSSVEDMNETIVANHNRLVRPTDLVYVLGDVGTRPLADLVSRLNGTLVLVRGNHDRESVGFYLRCGFSAIVDEVDLSVGRTLVTLRHVPTRTWAQQLSLIGVYIRTMRARRRSWTEIYRRIRREIRQSSRPLGRPVVCGHVHDHWATRGENINAGVDVRAFKPVHLHNLVSRGR